MSQQYQSPLKDFLLQQLAMVLHEARERSISLESCHELWREKLKERGHEADVDVLFDEIVYRSGLLRVDDDFIEFRHHILQEFFAGRSARQPSQFKNVLQDEWWRKPIIFYFGDQADNSAGILSLTEDADRLPLVEAYEAAVTLGLAIQACYLAETKDKVEAISWVVKSLGDACDEYIEQETERNKGLSLYAFISYYLYARDAVACDPVAVVANNLKKARAVTDEEIKSIERQMFWCIAGLVDANLMEQAELLSNVYKPSDPRFLMAIHLGCFHTANLRISDDDKRKIANRMCDRITPKVRPLIQQTVKEWRTCLLEMRKGEITAIEADEKGEDPVVS